MSRGHKLEPIWASSGGGFPQAHISFPIHLSVAVMFLQTISHMPGPCSEDEDNPAS